MEVPVQSTSDNAAEFAWRHDDVFGRIAGRYDVLCDVFSFGIHRLWKRRVARRIASERWTTLLDGATGTGDTSGTAQAQQGKILTWMQETGAVGMIFIGFPGSDKSKIAKCTGASAGCPTIWADSIALSSPRTRSSPPRRATTHWRGRRGSRRRRCATRN